jgi:tetratricopeptide (TPR) repeat protein
VNSWSGRANACFELDRYGEALGSYEKALAVDRENAHARNGKAAVLMKLGRIDESIGIYERSSFPILKI